MKMKVKLKNVRENPFRHIERYPLQPAKLAALSHSIKTTDFWENIVARKVGGTEDEPVIEIAYGHHRLAALKEHLGDMAPESSFDFIVKDLDDTAMCKIMINENMDEFSSSASVDQESIRALVQGYAEGRIVLDALEGKTSDNQIRQAPGFVQGASVSLELAHPYTAEQLIDFTGWSGDKVRNTLSALEKIEKGDTKDEDYEGLNSTQQKLLDTQVNYVLKLAHTEVMGFLDDEDQACATAAQARWDLIQEQTVKTVKAGLSDQTAKGFSARDATHNIIQVNSPQDPFPDIDKVAGKLANQLAGTLEEGKALRKKVTEVIKYHEYLSDAVFDHMVDSLRTLSEDALKLSETLERRRA